MRAPGFFSVKAKKIEAKYNFGVTNTNQKF
jgi:hypothetical protein